MVVAVQLIFTLGLALAFSALTVHFRDIRDLLANALTLWFFATPIIYPYFMPSVGRFLWLFRLNPFYHLAVSYQEVLFFDRFGHARSLLLLGVPLVTVNAMNRPLLDHAGLRWPPTGAPICVKSLTPLPSRRATRIVD